MAVDSGEGDGRDTAAAWIARLADELSAGSVDLQLQAAVLALARDVAHGTERKYAPLAAFVAGRHVQRRVTEGVTPNQALGEVNAAVQRLLDDAPSSA
jgi:hypothetical protein